MANKYRNETIRKRQRFEEKTGWEDINDAGKDRACLLYTSDAADE